MEHGAEEGGKTFFCFFFRRQWGSRSLEADFQSKDFERREEVVVGLLIGGVTLAGLVYYMYKSWGMPPVVSSVTNNEKELIQTI